MSRWPGRWTGRQENDRNPERPLTPFRPFNEKSAAVCPQADNACRAVERRAISRGLDAISLAATRDISANSSIPRSSAPWPPQDSRVAQRRREMTKFLVVFAALFAAGVLVVPTVGLAAHPVTQIA
jgi:hypothetical protein